jgi:hypothetical protein
MQPHLYTPSPEISAGGEFPVYLNTESPVGIFGVIDFGPGTYLHVPAADAERMIRALAKVVAFDRAYRQPHAFEPGDHDSRCARCGAGNAAHAEPEQAESVEAAAVSA